MLLLLQLVVTVREVDVVVRFKSAISRIATCVLIIAIAWVGLLGDYQHTLSYNNRVSVTTILTSAQIATAFVLFALLLLVKRRPAVFRPDGTIVDQQMNVSLWSRYTFLWSTDILRTAGKEGFGNKDLPAMDHIVRSETATASFRNMVLKDDSLPLWVLIFWQFRWQLIGQWIGILISNFFDVAPAFATLQLLKYLETRKDLDDMDPMAWKYVLGIVVASVSTHLVDSRIAWLVMSGTFWSYYPLSHHVLDGSPFSASHSNTSKQSSTSNIADPSMLTTLQCRCCSSAPSSSHWSDVRKIAEDQGFQ